MLYDVPADPRIDKCVAHFLSLGPDLTINTKYVRSIVGTLEDLQFNHDVHPMFRDMMAQQLRQFNLSFDDCLYIRLALIDALHVVMDLVEFDETTPTPTNNEGEDEFLAYMIRRSRP